MINDKNLTQDGGESSTNLQANTITVNNGISYADARGIALDVFKSNFLELSQIASQVAKERAEHLVDEFLKKLELEKPDKIQQIEDPDMQYALFSAQKDFARSGEKDLEQMLITILLERIDEEQQSLRKIVLNEALEIVSKLTNQQLDILTITFLTKDTKNGSINNKESLTDYLKAYYLPFINNLTKENSCYKHLEYLGCCGVVGIGVTSMSKYFLDNYSGIFSRGFEIEKFNNIVGNKDTLLPLVMKCFNNESLFQFNALDKDTLKHRVIEEFGETEELFGKLNSLFVNTTMHTSEVNNFLIELLPEMENLIDTWENSYMYAMTPTTVGMALAYINLKRKAGLGLDLGDWIK